jgi:hypothetical protein
VLSFDLPHAHFSFKLVNSDGFINMHHATYTHHHSNAYAACKRTRTYKIYIAASNSQSKVKDFDFDNESDVDNINNNININNDFDVTSSSYKLISMMRSYNAAAMTTPHGLLGHTASASLSYDDDGIISKKWKIPGTIDDYQIDTDSTTTHSQSQPQLDTDTGVTNEIFSDSFTFNRF